jgi:hypothetical protein
MRVLSRFRPVFIAALVAAGLTGCGGGGGGGAPTASSQSATPTVAINANNGQKIAAQAFQGSGALSLAGTSATGAVTALKSTSSEVAQHNAVYGFLAGFAAQRAQTLLGLTSAKVTPFAARAVNSSSTCAAGGSYSITGNVSDTGPAVGDTATATFNGCNDGTETVNGSLTFTITGISQGTPGTGGSVSLTVAMNQLSVSSSTMRDALDGSMSVTVQIAAVNSIAQTTKVTLTSPQISYTSSVYGTQTINGLNYVLFNNLQQGTWWFTQNVTVNNNGQVFSVTTQQQFAGSGCAYPSSGSAVVTGSKSSELITALTQNQTRLQIDENGDGMYDVTQIVPSSTVFAVVCSR